MVDVSNQGRTALENWIVNICTKPAYLQAGSSEFSQQCVSQISSELQTLMTRKTEAEMVEFFKAIRQEIRIRVEQENATFEDPEDFFAQTSTPNNTD